MSEIGLRSLVLGEENLSFNDIQSIVEVFPSPCLAVAPDGRVLWGVNDKALHLLGDTSTPASYSFVEALLSKEAGHLSKKLSSLKGNEPNSWDTRLRRSDNLLIEARVTAQLQVVGDRTVVMVVLRDKSVEARQKRYSNLLLSTLAHTTRHDFFEYFSQSLARITNMYCVGISRSTVEASCESIAYVVHGKIVPLTDQAELSLSCSVNEIEDIVIDSGDLENRYPNVRDADENPMRIFLGVPLVDPEGGVLGQLWAMDTSSAHDTDLIVETMTSYAPMVANELRRRLTDEEAERMRASLTQAQKLESLGVLAGGIAHDFNNLLTGILGNAELALSNTDVSHSTTANLEIIRQSSMHAADLCRQMLTYAGQGLTVNGPVDLNRVVTEMVQLLEMSISKRAKLELKLDEDMPVVAGDPSQLSQIVMNLITNASEALDGPNCGITLRTGSRYCNHRYLSQSWLADPLEPGVYAYLEVQDDGVGISDEAIQRIFDPFFTTKFAGRGLGLSAVLGIVRGHGGTLQIQTKVGVGTLMRVLFPATELQINPLVEAIKFRADSLEGRTILIADDDKTVLAATKAILNGAGANVLVANDGFEMVVLLKQIYDEAVFSVDLALVDLTMPRMDGIEAIDAMWEVDANIKGVLTSGYDEGDVAGQMQVSDQLSFLQKPYLSEQLIQVINEALEPRPQMIGG